MANRPLRQYYDGVPLVVADDLGSVVEPWVQQRRRLVDALRDLAEEQWKTPTRCDSWDVRGVVSHLVSVDTFWMMTLRAAQAHEAPTTYIRGFDPATGTDALVAAMLEQESATILEQLADSTDTFAALVEGFDAQDWQALCEAPFGHLPARIVLAHALWDSWLHERDIFEPLGDLPPVASDELLVATWFSLVMSGLQGGLLDDAAATGPIPEQPIDVALRFDGLSEPLRLRVDTGVRVERADARSAVDAGPAIDLVEIVTGRRPPSQLHPLPADFAAQVVRARGIL